MSQRKRAPDLPQDAISLTTYAQLDLYLAKFAAGELGLVILLGRHGTGKSEGVRHALGIQSAAEPAKGRVLHVEGHMQPFGLYCHLWEYRDCPVVLDDLDGLYADANCVRLLKSLCNTQSVRRIHWLTNITANSSDTPASFCTTSSVILIANEWRTLNANVQALEDRAIILHFAPSNKEIHRKVADWFVDREVYDFMARCMPMIPMLSMRYYAKALRLKNAGLGDWRHSVLQMVLADRATAMVLGLQLDAELTEKQRVDRFTAQSGQSRATYFRIKKQLPSLPTPQPMISTSDLCA